MINSLVTEEVTNNKMNVLRNDLINQLKSKKVMPYDDNIIALINLSPTVSVIFYNDYTNGEDNLYIKLSKINQNEYIEHSFSDIHQTMKNLLYKNGFTPKYTNENQVKKEILETLVLHYVKEFSVIDFVDDYIHFMIYVFLFRVGLTLLHHKEKTFIFKDKEAMRFIQNILTSDDDLVNLYLNKKTVKKGE